jgi:hypothetical protein
VFTPSGIVVEMKPTVMPITTPFSLAETMVLKAYSTQTVPADMPQERRLEWAKATQALVRRGALLKTARGIVVTPEGLAALLDTVPIGEMLG